MILLIAVSGMSLQAFAAKRDAAAANIKSEKTICQMNAGDTGLVKIKASSYEMAFQKVVDDCFQKRNDAYIQNRKEQPDQDRQILFAESCLNSVECA